MVKVISDPFEVTPEVLADVLGLDRRLIDTVEIEMFRDLPVSRIARFRVRYRSGGRGPATLFLKLSNPKADVSVNEISFYTDVAQLDTSQPVPRCYHAAADVSEGVSHLLLEDLSETHSQTEQDTAPDHRSSALAVRALAAIHARWWTAPEVGRSVGKVFDKEWLNGFRAQLERSVMDFVDEVEPDDDHVESLSLMVRNADRIWGRLIVREGLTVTHGDLHWWNFMFPRNIENDVRIIDWQLWHIDLGARDLAFLLALGGFAEPRPEIEAELLRIYHERLAECGVEIDLHELWRDYRVSAIRNLNIPVIFRAQGKHESTLRTALRRAHGAFERLACRELLD